MTTTQNPSEFYDKTFGTGESITGTNADLSELESQLRVIDDKISMLSEKIEKKKLEIEVITSGKALSDLDRAAREEYVRTGSSSAMQNIENSRANKESIRKENEQDSIVNADSAKDNLTRLFRIYQEKGKTLANDERKEVMDAWATLQKLKGKRGVVENDKDNNGVEDEIDVIVSDLRNAPTTASTKVAPKTNAELEKALGQLVTNEDKNALIDLYTRNHPYWYVNGDLDIDKIPAEETIAIARAIAKNATGEGKVTDTKKAAAAAAKAFRTDVLGKLKSYTTFIKLAKAGKANDKAWDKVIADISNAYAETKNAGKVDRVLIEDLLKGLK